MLKMLVNSKANTNIYILKLSTYGYQQLEKIILVRQKCKMMFVALNLFASFMYCTPNTVIDFPTITPAFVIALSRP